jgi:hypothetical protein
VVSIYPKRHILIGMGAKAVGLKQAMNIARHYAKCAITASIKAFS